MGIFFSSPDPPSSDRQIITTSVCGTPEFMTPAKHYRMIPKMETLIREHVTEDEMEEMLGAGEERMTDEEMQELKNKLMEKMQEVTKEEIQELKKQLMVNMLLLKEKKKQELEGNEMSVVDKLVFMEKLKCEKQELKKTLMKEFMVKKIEGVKMTEEKMSMLTP
ncbi:unnamed protein product [Urochloa humidicola]